ncbi:hypothetical protein GOP47_0000871 [Adiantum capillus-veneris]|uniref:Uncharacterized protein n=1 Tax=Adiantum capillus-veneris TaxID=13818 RepID=A0A9D4VFY6_ADICA|nr:hypothetical protein GOP47_0000871 [Adiantum capillus-veneris]
MGHRASGGEAGADVHPHGNAAIALRKLGRRPSATALFQEQGGLQQNSWRGAILQHGAAGSAHALVLGEAAGGEGHHAGASGGGVDLVGGRRRHHHGHGVQDPVGALWAL